MSSRTADKITVRQGLAELATGTDTDREASEHRRAAVFRYKFREIRCIMINL
jgi:hypothetical protein